MVFLGRIHRTIATLALIAVLTPLVTTAETPAEIKLKGAFLYNFTKFVKWPDNAFTNPAAPLNVCIIGEEELRDTLAQIVRDKKADMHPFVVRNAKANSDTKSCHVLFVPEHELAKLILFLTSTPQAGLLTISEGSSAKDPRVNVAAITLVPDSNRIRFCISTKAADKSGVEISSKLLSLAISVEK